MSSNYPPGAANDPNAPYNQEDVEMEVLITQKLEKTTSILTSNPNGQWSKEALTEAYQLQNRTALEVINACGAVIQEMISRGHHWYARTWLPTLLEDCKDWEEVETEVQDGDIIDPTLIEFV